MDRKSRTSRLATLDETNEEVNLWKQICNSLAKLEVIQKNTASVVTNINEIHATTNLDEGKTKKNYSFFFGLGQSGNKSM
jgi:hypothetical protein